MKTNLTKLLCTLVLFGAAAATASPMTYTETSYLSGTLGDTPFDNAAVTLTTIGDTANIQRVIFDENPFQIPVNYLIGTTTIQIEGLSLATFNGSDDFGVFAEDLSDFNPGLGAVGMLDYTQLIGILATYDDTPSYDLSTSATFTSPAGYNDPFGFVTDQGTLLITDAPGNTTFTASTAAVPEPSQVVSMLALSVMGGAGALVKFRRRK